MMHQPIYVLFFLLSFFQPGWTQHRAYFQLSVEGIPSGERYFAKVTVNGNCYRTRSLTKNSGGPLLWWGLFRIPFASPNFFIEVREDKSGQKDEEIGTASFYASSNDAIPNPLPITKDGKITGYLKFIAKTSGDSFVCEACDERCEGKFQTNVTSVRDTTRSE